MSIIHILYELSSIISTPSTKKIEKRKQIPHSNTKPEPKLEPVTEPVPELSPESLLALSSGPSRVSRSKSLTHQPSNSSIKATPILTWLSCVLSDSSVSSSNLQRETQKQTRRLSVSLMSKRLSAKANVGPIFVSQTPGTSMEEINDFLAGGRNNPNPFLYEAEIIKELQQDFGMMTVDELRQEGRLVKEIIVKEILEEEKCKSHGWKKAGCSRCFLEEMENRQQHRRWRGRRVMSYMPLMNTPQ